MDGRIVLVGCVLIMFELAAVYGVKIDAPQQQSVIAGSDALIRCAAKEEGTEKIGRIVWRGKDYQEIPNGGRYQLSREGLTISDVRASDGGFYVCEVRLARGSNHGHGTFYQKFIDVTVE